MPKRTLLFLLLSGGLAGAAQAQTAPAAGVTPAATAVRGQTSVSTTHSPLLIVDGVLVSDKQLNDLDPADIESISVLKSVSVANVFPNAGSRGVLIITTKNAQRAARKRTPDKLLIRPDEISRQPIGQ